MENEAKKPLTLGKGKLELKKTIETGQVRQTFSHGRSKVVQVERKRKRQFEMGADGKVQEIKKQDKVSTKESNINDADENIQRKLSAEEKAHRLKVLKQAKEEEDTVQNVQESDNESEENKSILNENLKTDSEDINEQNDTIKTSPTISDVIPEQEEVKFEEPRKKDLNEKELEKKLSEDDNDEEVITKKQTKGPKSPGSKRNEERRRMGKLTISAALEEDYNIDRGRSMAALRRAREKEKRQQDESKTSTIPSEKISREVTLPEHITVQELSNRMAERSSNVIKSLMKLGIMATINEVVDADTAELIAQEFGHKVKRISEDDVLTGLSLGENNDAPKVKRPPVVTIMGHVDHGKTSLLDALRESKITSNEAGGITQHIGAYQLRLDEERKITFIDTPGHEAFSSMRARGASVTDIVILVVAADDGIMPQTIEAIKHTQAANVPIIVAINKIDKPESNPQKIKQELLSHEIVVEEMGGETLSVEISAIKKINLEQLLEAIQLQAELLDLQAAVTVPAEGVVIESKIEKGKGSVATVLIQQGTLHLGNVFVAGSEWGKVRALINDQGTSIKSAQPATPIEILGFNGTPNAGDDFIAVDNESRAREVSDFRSQKIRDKLSSINSSSMEQMFAKINSGEIEEMPVLVKADTNGSAEALRNALEKIGNDTAKIKIIHCAVGPINESDITLAMASHSIIIGFNVRANSQAKEIARKENIDIRYYSIIYNVSDDVTNLLLGKLKPTYKENFLGYAEILEVFSISKVGKIAGCKVTEGIIKRGCKVRLLRDNTVIHEGDLSQLKRFKDDVKEVKDGLECGAAFANYQDIQVTDRIECFELEELEKSL